MTVKWVYQNEVNDIFEITNENGDVEYVKFPRTMEMTEEDVAEHLSDY